MAELYGLGIGTIRDIRAGQRGRAMMPPQSEPSDDSFSVAELAGRMLKELAALAK